MNININKTNEIVKTYGNVEEERQITKLEERSLLASAKCTAIFGAGRDYYTDLILNEQEIELKKLRYEKSKATNKAHIKSLNDKIKSVLNKTQTKLSEFDKYAGNILKKIEAHSEGLFDYVDNCTSTMNDYLNKRILLRDKKLVIVRNAPVMLLSVEDYAEYMNLDLIAVKNAIKESKVENVLKNENDEILIAI